MGYEWPHESAKWLLEKNQLKAWSLDSVALWFWAWGGEQRSVKVAGSGRHCLGFV